MGYLNFLKLWLVPINALLHCLCTKLGPDCYFSKTLFSLFQVNSLWVLNLFISTTFSSGLLLPLSFSHLAWGLRKEEDYYGEGRHLKIAYLYTIVRKFPHHRDVSNGIIGSILKIVFIKILLIEDGWAFLWSTIYLKEKNSTSPLDLNISLCSYMVIRDNAFMLKSFVDTIYLISSDIPCTQNLDTLIH